MQSSKPLGGIPLERMVGIPPHLRLLHELTFSFHDRVVQAMKEVDDFGPRAYEVKVPPELDLTAEDVRSLDGVALARAAGAHDTAKNMLLGECILALIADALNFICEALFSYEKGKITVSLSLMRKPMKENLLFLEWILQDEDDFFRALGSEDREELGIERLPPERRRQIIEGALKRIDGAVFTDAQALYDLRYDKASNGLEPLWQKAQHLTTTRHANLRTEVENLNFIFATPDNIAGIYEHVGPSYFLLVLHFYEVALTALQRTYEVDPNIRTIEKLARTAAVVMARGQSQSLDETFREVARLCVGYVTCECGGAPQITGETFARALFSRELPCSVCGGATPFDLYSLMATSEGGDIS